jgi:hypothetical protein
VSAEWVDFRITEKGREEIQSRQFEILDLRDSLDPIQEAARFLAENPDSLVWGEGQTPKEFRCKGRNELAQTSTLVIWTAPPSQSVLDEVIQRTKPRRILVFGLQPATTSMKAFLERLGGLAKFAVKHKDGMTTLEELASACASTNVSVRLGLKVWEAMGKLKINFQDSFVEFSLNNKIPDSAAIKIYKEALKASLKEISVYRHYYHSGKIQNYFSCITDN